ncbi:MAG: response regulator transcription factor [Chloroflexota bacterium]
MNVAADPIRILVADDNSEFREGLGAMLAPVEDMAIVAYAATGSEVVALAGRLQPDVVLMDLQMPGGNGIDATRAIVGSSPHIGVLALTMFEDDASVFSVMRAGARGYLLKGAPKSELLRAIRAVANGEAIFGPAVARRLIGFFGETDGPSAPLFPELTEREREVLALISQGRTNGDIAAQLVLSLKTVQNHVSNICQKLQVVDRTQAVLRAREAGLR